MRILMPLVYGAGYRRGFMIVAAVTFLTGSLTGCSIARGLAVNMVGNAIASGGTTFESDEDIELVGDALPFALKFIETLLAEAPEHEGLLLAATRNFTAYAYAYVEWEADQLRDVDLAESRRLRARAGRLYERAFRYGMRGLEKSRNGFAARFRANPDAAVLSLEEDDIEMAYWTAAALGLAISAGRNEPAMLARLPDVEALLGRALDLDEAWQDGALHEFEVVLAGARPGPRNNEDIRRHFERAETLSAGNHAGLYVAYAEAVAVPGQDMTLFREMLDRALAIDPDEHEEVRLVNLIAQDRARWLLGRAEDLILVPDELQGAQR